MKKINKSNLIFYILIIVTATAMIITLAACADSPSKDTDTEAVSGTESESEKESDTETGKETGTETETEAGTESDTETETSPATDTEKAHVTDNTPSGGTEAGTNEQTIDIGGGGSSSGSSGGNFSGNTSSGSSGGTTEYIPGAGTKDKSLDPGDGFGLNTTTGGRVHTYASAPSLEYEDTSNTLSFMPLRAEGATDPGASYNRPKVAEKDIAPGYVYNGGANYQTTYVGYDGFLFCDDTMHDYDGTTMYVDELFTRLVDNMVKRNEWVESVGKKMYIVFIPNKNSVYPEYMPEGYPMGSYRRIDQVVNGLRAAGINVIDGRDSLLAAKAANPTRALYYKTDTHWNNHGGFEVYLQTMNAVKKDFPNAVVHTRSDYQVNYAETYMKDQTYYIGYYDATSEPGPVYTLKSGMTATLAYAAPRDKWGQFAFCYQWPNGYSDHLYYYTWRNDYNSSAPSMYMLRDSYSIALNGFFKDSFYKSTYNWSFAFSKSDILNSGADVIICEVVEKNITSFLSQSTFVN